MRDNRLACDMGFGWPFFLKKTKSKKKTWTVDFPSLSLSVLYECSFMNQHAFQKEKKRKEK